MTQKPTPHWPEDGKDYVIGYMCLIAFECELGAASGGNTVYPSIESLKKNHDCWKGCGIVEVKVDGVRVVAEAIEEDFDELDRVYGVDE